MSVMTRTPASQADLRVFLERAYGADVFNAKGGEWAGGGTRADMLVAEHERRLRKWGASSVGRFVSATHETIWFDAQLRVLPGNPIARPPRREAPRPPAAKGRKR